MKIKTQDLIGLPLDWAVTVASGAVSRYSIKLEDFKEAWGGGQEWARPSTCRGQGCAIVEKHNISTNRVFVNGKPESWECNTHDLKYDEAGEYIEGSDHLMSGPTMTIAGMRTYVSSLLGDEVEIPDVLIGD